jgi:hypothetical protein
MTPEHIAFSEAHSNRSFSKRALRAVFYLGGLVATTAGLHTAIAGAKSVPGQGLANAAVESELRFYGAFYFAYGLVLLRAARRADNDPTTVRSLMSTLFVAGLARAGGWVAVGRPHKHQRGLLVIELTAPPLIAAWQARLATAESRTV